MNIPQNGESVCYKAGEKDDKLYFAVDGSEILIIEDEKDVTLETYVRQNGTGAFVKTENISDDEKADMAHGIVSALLAHVEMTRNATYSFEPVGATTQAGRPCHIYTLTGTDVTVAFYIDDATKCCLKCENDDTHELLNEVTVFQESGFTLPDRP